MTVMMIRGLVRHTAPSADKMETGGKIAIAHTSFPRLRQPATSAPRDRKPENKARLSASNAAAAGAMGSMVFTDATCAHSISVQLWF